MGIMSRKTIEQKEERNLLLKGIYTDSTQKPTQKYQGKNDIDHEEGNPLTEPEVSAREAQM